MKARILVGVAVIAAALIPWTATATATGGEDPSTGAIDIVYAEMDGSDEINVYGTLRCGVSMVDPLGIDVVLEQSSTGGMGGGGSNSYTCLEPGDTIKWLIDATGGRWLIGDEVTITAVAAGPTVATKTENHVLHWGLPTGADD